MLHMALSQKKGTPRVDLDGGADPPLAPDSTAAAAP